MTKDPSDNESFQEDAAALARDFADLWAKQMSAMANDPALSAGMAEAMKFWQGAGSANAGIPSNPFADMMKGFAAAAQQGDPTDGQPDFSPHQSPPYQSPSSASASQRSEQLLVELAERMARIEERLTALESGAGANSAATEGARGKSATKRSAKKAAGKRAAGKRSKPSI